MPPKTAFIAGLVTGVLVLCTVGFFILLAIVFKGGLKGGMLADATNKPVVVDTGTQKPTPAAPAPAPAAGAVKPISAADHIRGNKNAKVTMVEYSDYECPFCKTFHPTIARLAGEYKDKVRWVYRHFPLSFHQNAQKEAEAAECVAEIAGNDAFWKFTDSIFERTRSNGQGFALADLPGLAAEVGANKAKFETCLNSGKYATPIQESIQAATGSGIEGTPGTIVLASNGQSKLVSGAVDYATLKSAVDSLLQ